MDERNGRLESVDPRFGGKGRDETNRLMEIVAYPGWTEDPIPASSCARCEAGYVSCHAFIR